MFTYRQEIDGLRTIAVVPVIFYHAGLQTYFSGGYVGVDIFFVISGYLITSVIHHECEQQTFSLIHFYERRCRRILPALFFILYFSSFLAYYLMLPEKLKEFGESLLSIVCLSSNIYFWWKDDGYFSELSELNPLVHTWSLAVEEQFYLIFPILCYSFRGKTASLINVLIVLGTISFSLCQWGGNFQMMSVDQLQMFSQYHYATFYLPLGRVWELLIGALIALYLHDNDITKRFSRKSTELFSLFGLLLILNSIFFLDNRNIPPFPNAYTLIPVCGAGLIIVFGNNKTLVGYLLSTRPFRWLGLLSYSAYLWHQPLLAFVRLQSNERIQIVHVIITILPLSVVSYFAIEQPFRDKKRFSSMQIFSLSALGFLLTLIIGVFLIRTANDRSEKISPGDDSYLSDLRKYGSVQYVEQGFANVQKKSPRFSNRTIDKKLVLIGDSFAQDFYNVINEGKHLIDYDIRVYFVYSRCQIYLGAEDRQHFIEVQHRQTCTNANDIKYALPLIRQANVIILASNWYQWSAQRLPMTIKLLNLTEHQQIFVIGAKHFGKINHQLYVNKSPEFRMKQYQFPKSEVANVNSLLEKNVDQSIFVNVMKMVCKGVNQTCPLFTDAGKLMSHDGAHLTKFGARYIGDIVFRRKPLNKL